LHLAQTEVVGTIDDPGYEPMVVPEGETLGGDAGIAALVQPSAIVLSPEPGNPHVYVTSESGDRVLQFAREPAGSLVYQKAYSASTPGFSEVKLDGAHDLAISSDGRHLYAAAQAGNAISVFERDLATGDLSFVQSQTDAQVDATAEGGTVRGLQGATALVLSPDNQHLYVVGATGNSLAVFAREPSTGVLRFLEAELEATNDASDVGPAPNGLIRPADVLVSQDGAQVYVAARFGDALLTFARTTDSGDAGFGRVSFVSSHRDGQLGIEGLGGAYGLALSPDGLHLYVVSEDDNAVVLFDRAGDGSLLRRSQWSKGDVGLPGLGGAQAIAISSDGAELFVAGFADHSLTSFERSVSAGGGLAAGDLRARQTLIDGDPGVSNMAGPVALALSNDERNVYVAANIDNAIVRFRRSSFPNGIFADGFE
jgi:6-phosphogluconolactonase (cycloisomerase 2 family)